MMDRIQWTPEVTFFATFVLGALGGVYQLVSNPRAPLTLRSFLAAIIYNGTAGMGLGMIVWEWGGGNENHWRVILCGILVGLKLLTARDIKKIIHRNLSIDDDDHKRK